MKLGRKQSRRAKRPTPGQGNGKARTLFIWLAMVALFLGLMTLAREEPRHHDEFAALLQHVEDGWVREIRIQDNRIDVDLWDGTLYTTLGVVDEELTRQLSESGVEIHLGEGRCSWPGSRSFSWSPCSSTSSGRPAAAPATS